MKEVNINHIDIDLDGDGIPEKYILKDKVLNASFQTLANIAFSSDYNDLINQPDSLPASDVYEWAKNIAKPEYTKNEIGLENVDNTSDLNKPVSIAQQKAIDDAYANSNGYTDQKISELINGAPTSLDTLGELAKAMTDNADVVSALEQTIGSKANSNEFDSHVGNDTIHITSSERNKWNSAISGTDDTKDNVVSFTNNDTTNPTSWSDVSVLTSGEKHISIFTKISTMFKNIRYLYKLIGTTDISAIGNGTITGGLSTLNSNLSKKSGTQSNGNAYLNVDAYYVKYGNVVQAYFSIKINSTITPGSTNSMNLLNLPKPTLQAKAMSCIASNLFIGTLNITGQFSLYNIDELATSYSTGFNMTYLTDEI